MGYLFCSFSSLLFLLMLRFSWGSVNKEIYSYLEVKLL